MDSTARTRSWFLSFLLLNALKVSLAGVALQAAIGPWLLLYKFCFSLLPLVAFYLALLALGSRPLLVCCYALQALYLLAQVSTFERHGGYLHVLDPTSLASLELHADQRSLVLLLDLPALLAVLGGFPGLRSSRGLALPLWLGAAAAFALAVSINEAWCYANGESLSGLAARGKPLEPEIVERYGPLLNELISPFLPAAEKKAPPADQP